MKRVIVLSVAMLILVVIFATPRADATLMTGSPSPTLTPVFGTLINFDDKATGTPISSNDYVALGVASIDMIGPFARYTGTQSAPNYVGTGVGYEQYGESLGWDGTITFGFSGLASQVGIGVANSQGGPETISVYGTSMNLLESYTVPSGFNVYAYITRSSADIKYFRITGDFFAVDDLQHNAVPEPATLLLVGTGLIGLVGIGRKRLLK